MLTVTTWNLQNLFPAGTAAGPPTDGAYDAKLDSLAATIAPGAVVVQHDDHRSLPVQVDPYVRSHGEPPRSMGLVSATSSFIRTRGPNQSGEASNRRPAPHGITFGRVDSPTRPRQLGSSAGRAEAHRSHRVAPARVWRPSGCRHQPP
jgi:hypothetical protein